MLLFATIPAAGSWNMGLLETCILVASCVCIISLVILLISLWTARRGSRIKKFRRKDPELAISMASSAEVPLISSNVPHGVKITDYVDANNMSSSGSGLSPLITSFDHSLICNSIISQDCRCWSRGALHGRSSCWTRSERADSVRCGKAGGEVNWWP